MPKIKCEIYWRCKVRRISKPQQSLIKEIVQDLVKQVGAVKANIRAEIHATSTAGRVRIDPKTGRRRLALDPLGDHITFEILDPKTDMWTNFHFYVMESVVDHRKTWIKNPFIDPNPVAYPPEIVSKCKILLDEHGLPRADPRYTFEYELD